MNAIAHLFNSWLWNACTSYSRNMNSFEGNTFEDVWIGCMFSRCAEIAILMHALQGASSSRDHVGSGYAWQLIYDASHGFFSLHIRVNKTIQRDLRFLGHVTSHFKVKQPLECVFIIINIIGNQLVLFEMHDFVSFMFSHITIIL